MSVIDVGVHSLCRIDNDVSDANTNVYGDASWGAICVKLKKSEYLHI